MNPELALRFAALFDGRKDAYGANDGYVVRSPLTSRMYLDHLTGQFNAGIGVFPLRDDGTVRFAAVDLDEPNADLAMDIHALIPGKSYIEQSRSGNFHIWVFFDRDVPAWVARANLRDALEAAGAPRVEVFPKQDDLLPGMVGNYINLPYLGDERKIHRPWKGLPEMPLEDFLDDAEIHRTDGEHWQRLAIQAGHRPPGELSGDGTPFGERDSVHECATYMLKHKDDNPLAHGHRHVVLFNLAKMLLNAKGFDEDLVREMVGTYNEAGLDPVGEDEVRSIVSNAARGRYTSTGCDNPLMEPYVSPECPIAKAVK